MNELVVDSFAGGGGASTGIERALGRPVDIAINHSPEAIAMHRANHPATRHYQEDIWQVDPKEACGSRPVGLAWFSPDCTHFSKAKGAAPRSREIRGLADVVIRWARAVRPRVIALENVEEFATWGPLGEDGRPDGLRSGEDFGRWLGELAGCGYTIEHRSLVAADHGAPTTRKRLFLVAHRDGTSAAWPASSHGKGAPQAWRTAAEVIDWSLPCPSIFTRKRPLAEATMRRIAAGLRRYVLESAQPFLVKYHGGQGRGPWRGQGIDEPVRTVDTENRFGLVAPTLIQTGYGERIGQAPRVPGLHKPLGTVVGEQKHALVAAFLAKHYGGVVGHGVERPIGTVTTQDHHSLVSASFVSKFYGTATHGAPVDAPLPTVTATGQHLAEVRAFLVKYYGSDGSPVSQQQGLFDPLHTVTTKARFGLVTIHGVDYQIADIGMRMLQPRELFAAQGFPDDYVIDLEYRGKPLTKTAQIALCGNSVCPPVAEAIVAANVGRA